MPAGRRCRHCPRIIGAGAYRGLCPSCARARDRARGTPTDRGYGSTILSTPLGTMTYDQCRRAYQRMLDDGAVLHCACGCGRLVTEGFHLAHDELDRTVIVGPMTSGCNLRLAGRASRRTPGGGGSEALTGSTAGEVLRSPGG